MRRFAVLFATFSAAGLVSSIASASVEHTVGKGHTLQAIANRYHVSVKAIMEANHLADGKHLRPGETLIIPTAEGTKDKGAKAKAAKEGKEPAKADAKSGKAGAKTATYAAKAKTPGVVHLKRLATSEAATVRIADKSGKIAPATLKTMEKMLRFPNGQAHPIDARLISLLGVVSNHFGSRTIEVVSGFRPFTPTQYTPHSNHNHGKAVDFHVVGVPNEAVRDFCRSLKSTGCGYYPNSTFVHMDVRDASAFWIDYSKPGEPPRYNAPNVEADEGTSDVHATAEAAASEGASASSTSEPSSTAPSEPSTTESSPAQPATTTEGE